MKKWIWITLLIFVGLLSIAAIAVISASKRLKFEVEYASFEIPDGWEAITNLFNNQGFIKLNFLVKTSNQNSFVIPIKDLETRVYYKGQLIGGSSPSALKNIDLPGRADMDWIEPIDIGVKSDSIKAMLQDLWAGRDPEIYYETELKVWGIRYTYTDRIRIIETATS